MQSRGTGHALGKFPFRIATFGLAKLTQVIPGNRAAQSLFNAWLPTRGGAPLPISRELIREALADCWGIPDVFVDARCFRPPPRDWTSHHVGLSYELTRRLNVDDWNTFQLMWSNLMRDINASVGGSAPMNIVVYCRAGEKRSVAIAWLLAQALGVHAGGTMRGEPIKHLCMNFWGRNTCAGWDCTECYMSDRHRHLVVGLAEHTRVPGAHRDQ